MYLHLVVYLNDPYWFTSPLLGIFCQFELAPWVIRVSAVNEYRHLKMIRFMPWPTGTRNACYRNYSQADKVLPYRARCSCLVLSCLLVISLVVKDTALPKDNIKSEVSKFWITLLHVHIFKIKLLDCFFFLIIKHSTDVHLLYSNNIKVCYLNIRNFFSFSKFKCLAFPCIIISTFCIY